MSPEAEPTRIGDSAQTRSPSARIRADRDRWIGNPLQWSAYRRALGMQALISPFLILALLRGAYLIENPEVEPFADRRVLVPLVTGLCGFFVLAAVTALVGLLQERRGGESRFFPHVVVQLYFILWAAAAYLHGLPTSPFWVVFPLLAISSLLLFDMRVAVAGIVTALAISFGTTILERAGAIPFAPIITEKAFADGHPPDAWIWPSMIWPPITSLAAFGVFAFVLNRSREQERRLSEAKDRLEAELRDAARYARSVLPDPTLPGDAIRAAWSWVPCRELGGDLLTYFELDAGLRYGIAVVDVCGHGVGGALHAVSAAQTLRRGRLPGVDRCDPAAVLVAMNEAFPMEEHDGLFFTLWYGVLDLEKETLRYASGGHPAALLFTHGRSGEAPRELTTRGPIVGAIDGAAYQSAEVPLHGGADLFVFSDGVFELSLADGRQLDRSDFHRELARLAAGEELRPDDMYASALRLTGLAELEDDFTLVHIRLSGRDGDQRLPISELR